MTKKKQEIFYKYVALASILVFAIVSVFAYSVLPSDAQSAEDMFNIQSITILGNDGELFTFFGGEPKGEKAFGGTSNLDSLALEDDGTIYFNNGTGSYGIRDNGGTIQFKNEGGSWSLLGATPIVGGGWIADGNNQFEYPTSNSSGIPYPIILGGNATTSAWVATDELFINGSFSATGAANIDGAMNVAGASVLVGNTTISGTLTQTGAATLSSNLSVGGTLTQTGVATFSADPIINGTTPTLTIGDGGSEDTGIVFNGVQDFRIGIYDSTDDLEIGAGTTWGTTPAISITDGLAVTIAGTLTQTGAVSMASTLNVDGAMTAAAITTDGIFTTTSNILGANGTLSGTLTGTGDLIWDTNTLYVDVSANKVGFGTTTPLTEWVEISDGFQIFDSTSPYDAIIHGYDSDDDGVLDILANAAVTVKLHAAGDSYFLGGGFGIGTTTACGLSVGATSPNTTCAGDNDAYIEGTLEVDGAVDFDGAINVAGASTLVGAVGITGATVLGAGVTADFESVTATTTLTAASGNTVLLAASADQITITLPAATAGLRYEFIVVGALTGPSVTIVSAETANIEGILMVNDADVVCATEDQINIITATEVVGDRVELISDGSSWFIVDSDCDATVTMTCTT